MLTEEHLRSLTTYLLNTANDMEKREKENGAPPLLPNVGSGDPPEVTDDPIHVIRKLARQIEVLSYDPVLFESMLEEYDLNVGPLDKPLEDVPLHINDESPVAQAIVKWRLENAV